MTAEIVILNKTAVALATDSAVTIGRKKVYNSADKLFTLSKYHPVGIMIYGSAELTGVPWEVIIKLYREQLRKKSFPKLEGYANDLINFLNTGRIVFSSQDQTNYMIFNTKGYFDQIILKEIEDSVQEKIKENKKVKTDDISEGIIANHHKDWNEMALLPSFSKEFIRKFKKKHKKLISDIIKDSFDKIPLSSKSKNQLIDICANLHTKRYFRPGNGSGFVIAGYGNSEIYPSLCSYRSECVIENKLKYEKDEDKSTQIGEEILASVTPFAQDEMVHTILTGLDPKLRSYSTNLLYKVFKDFPELILGKINTRTKARKNALEKDFMEVSMGLFDDYNEAMHTYAKDKHTNPIVEMVQFLPKDELASMAETLVSLTKFKRRISKDMETVGGPIDVAVISKGDGFVWIKRKHYFKLDSNRGFFENYFMGDKNG